MFNYDLASSRSFTSNVADDDGELDEGPNCTSVFAMPDYDKLEFAVYGRSIFKPQSDSTAACNVTMTYRQPALPLFCPQCSAEFSGKARNKKLVGHMTSAHSSHIYQHLLVRIVNIAIPRHLKNSTYQTNSSTVNATLTTNQAIQLTTRDNNVYYPQDSLSTISHPCCNQQFIGKSFFKALELHRSKEHPLTYITYTCSKYLQLSSPYSILIRAHTARCNKPLSTTTLPANPVIINGTISHATTDSDTCRTSRTDHTILQNGITNDSQPHSIINNSTPQRELDKQQNTADIDYSQDNLEEPHAASTTSTDIPASFEADLMNETTDIYSNSKCSSVSIAIISEYMNNMHSDSRLHPRLRNLTIVLLSEVSGTNYSYKILIDRFVPLYTVYLTRIDEQLRTTYFNRLESLSLNSVHLKPSADLIMRSISHAIYKNPTRHSDVRQTLISKLKSDINYWLSQASTLFRTINCSQTAPIHRYSVYK
ncbi:hypothetical protein GJ496_009787 [Pomphorhynchus laevis]|nr:hypothetical protein GJ496_009787 [Pomphorhynchus laevis]